MALTGTGAYGTTHNNGLTNTAASSTVASTTAAARKAATGNSSPAVIISLSQSALAALQAQNNADAGNYAAYFPTRDGASAEALAAAVGNPGDTSSSTGKTFAQVATDARSRMDQQYATMRATGQPFDHDSTTGKDWHTLMGELDRRSLYAVSSNESGLFTQQEQDIAQSIMRQQQGLAMGLYSGPNDQAESFHDPFSGNVTARFAAARAFLADVSAEEKQSGEWQQQSTLAAQLAPQSDATSSQPMTLFDFLAAADKTQDAAQTLFNNSAAYTQIARLSN